MRRIAILPGNILVPDVTSAWLATGLPIVLQNDLATASHIAAVSVESQSQAYQSGASHGLQATVELRNQQWRLTVTVIDLASQMVSDTFVGAGAESSGVIALANTVASHLDPRASTFSTRHDAALQQYVQGVTTADPNIRMNSLQNAIQSDPGFGLAYLSAIETLAQSDPAAASDLLHRAAAKRAQFTPLDQARLDAISARLSHAPLSHQASATAALLKLTPNNLDALISLASLRFLGGDGKAGTQVLENALSLSPGNEAVRTYLAAGLFETRQFRDAERVFQSLQANPAILPQLAVCVLLEGDTARADSIFARYLKLQQPGGQAASSLLQANWLALNGKLQDAVTLLKSTQFPSGDLRSLALSQSAVLETMRKDRASAAADAAAAIASASSPPVKALAIAASLIGSPAPSPQSFNERVNAAILSADQKGVVLGYGLFLNEHFSEAAEAWKTMYAQSGGTDLRSRLMLAASLDRAGRPADSNAPPIAPFLPNLTGGDEYAPVAFAEMRRLLRR